MSFQILIDTIVHNEFCQFSEILVVHKNDAHVYYCKEIDFELIMNDKVKKKPLFRKLRNNSRAMYQVDNE